MKRITWKRIGLALAVVLLLALAAGTLAWSGATKEPTDVALAALETNNRVRVSQEKNLIAFEPVGATPSVGLVFYPGGGVDYRAYAPLADEVAARGYAVVLLEVPLNLAFFSTNAADRAVERFPNVDRWIVAGHSLGGVVAAGYAAGHPEVAGLSLWASYPSGDALATADVAVVSIYGTLDGLTTVADIDRSRALLPADAQFVAIEGGNHAQFGAYGLQDGDGTATIPPEAQWAQIVASTVALLQQVSE